MRFHQRPATVPAAGEAYRGAATAHSPLSPYPPERSATAASCSLTRNSWAVSCISPVSLAKDTKRAAFAHKLIDEPCNQFAAFRVRIERIRCTPCAAAARSCSARRGAGRAMPEPPCAEPIHEHRCRITAVHPHHHPLATTRAPISATALRYNPSRVERLAAVHAVFNRTGLQLSRSTDGSCPCSCIPMANLMQLRAANDGVEPILLSSYSFQGPLPNQQPRRGLV